jgi:hypothetical protein
MMVRSRSSFTRVLFFFFLGFAGTLPAQQFTPKDLSLQVEAILSKMTLAEKISILGGGDATGQGTKGFSAP